MTSVDLDQFLTQLTQPLLNESGMEISVRQTDLWKYIQTHLSQSTFRAALMEKLEEHAPLNLQSIDAFASLCELLRLFAHASRYEVHLLRQIYKYSVHARLFITLGRVEVSCRSALIKLPVWSNLPFWIDTAMDFFTYDMELMNLVAEELSVGLGRSFTFIEGLTVSQCKLLMISYRFQAMITSMETLGLGKEAIQSFYQTMTEKLRCKEHGIDLLVDYAKHGRMLLWQTLVEYYAKCNALSISPLYRAVIMPGHGSDRRIVLHPTVDRHSAGSDEIGYSSLVQLLLMIITAEYVIYRYRKRDEALVQLSNASAMTICMCGGALNKWQLLGEESNEEMRLMLSLQGRISSPHSESSPFLGDLTSDKLCGNVCEVCYRSVSAANISYDLTEAIGACPTVDQRSSMIDWRELRATRSMECMEFVDKLVANHVPSVAIHSMVRSHASTRVAWMQHPTSQQSFASTTSNPSHPTASVLRTRQSSLLLGVQKQPMTNVPHRMTEHPLPATIHPTTTVSTTDDDASVMSGSYHHEGVSSPPDDESITSMGIPRKTSSNNAPTTSSHSAKSRSEVPQLTDSEFIYFFHNLWVGIPVNLIYSYNPYVEKTRLLYLRSDDAHQESVLKAHMMNLHRSDSSEVAAVIHWLSTNRTMPLHLGWAHLTEQNKLKYNPSKCLPLHDIKNIKVGSNKWKNCVKIGTTAKMIVIKIDHDEQFNLLLGGLTQLITILHGHQQSR